MNLTAIYEPAEEGGYTCYIEEFPEVFSEGETLEQAKMNLLDALHEVVSWHRDQARQQPPRQGAVRETLLAVGT
jgi:predicted RNase H-like HicB family nuclease